MNRTSFDERIVYGIVTVAVALSYATLAGLAERAGYSTPMAWAWPIAVEGLAIMAARAATQLRTGRRYAQGLLVATTTISVAAGAASRLLPAGPLPGWAGACVAVIPALCVLVAPHLAVQMRRDAAGASDVATEATPAIGEAPVVALETVEATHNSELVVAPDQARRTTTQPEPQRDALFDMPARGDAPTPMSRDDMRAEALHLLATTNLSQRAVADRVGTSEASVRRWRKAADAADATPALAAVGG